MQDGPPDFPQSGNMPVVPHRAVLQVFGRFFTRRRVLSAPATQPRKFLFSPYLFPSPELCKKANAVPKY